MFQNVIRALCLCFIVFPFFVKSQSSEYEKDIFHFHADTYSIEVQFENDIVWYEAKRKDLKKEFHWIRNGRIHVTQGFYNSNPLNGPFRKFNNNDDLIEFGVFEMGLKAGKWYFWNEKSELIRIEIYKDGSLEHSITDIGEYIR
ncbi:MAG: hypothetical protein RBR21_08440 [Bacteroidales bacterium]|jgi:antitoxin component YwqK of YwqJK toxin-antitoxin module|nr:hypothetical protein [Bacteroidales bacterium]